ncbi:hypothetical protein CC80DRAFT_328979 [Byssothecium circinans]|uniref:Uncharacterized protein n=1 Tax=Byssothecium circinans TaxID=147558 RepID=A0A6A5T6K4_9PLEO|nr:hypothetical protein CC80DRAFT_328979 [Byssothecium circinans]
MYNIYESRRENQARTTYTANSSARGPLLHRIPSPEAKKGKRWKPNTAARMSIATKSPENPCCIIPVRDPLPSLTCIKQHFSPQPRVR